MIEIKTIEIDVNGVTLKLSPEQASELKSKLDNLLGSTTYLPYQPSIPFQPYQPFWYQNQPMCEVDTTITSSTQNANDFDNVIYVV